MHIEQNRNKAIVHTYGLLKLKVDNVLKDGESPSGRQILEGDPQRKKTIFKTYFNFCNSFLDTTPENCYIDKLIISGNV
jgi:hypothetical protein